jgi:hypothetical protein
MGRGRGGGGGGGGGLSKPDAQGRVAGVGGAQLWGEVADRMLGVRPGRTREVSPPPSTRVSVVGQPLVTLFREGEGKYPGTYGVSHFDPTARRYAEPISKVGLTRSQARREIIRALRATRTNDPERWEQRLREFLE